MNKILLFLFVFQHQHHVHVVDLHRNLDDDDEDVLVNKQHLKMHVYKLDTNKIKNDYLILIKK